MKKVLSVVTCSILAACSCNENQWEEVDVVTYDDAPVYEEQVVEQAPVEVTPAKVIVEQEPVYMPAVQTVAQPVYSCPCAVQVACYQPVCYQPCPCMQPAPQPAPQPKVTTTRKVITTTTTIEEPCGKPVCEPVVTTHEEVLPAEVSYNQYAEPTQVSVPAEDYVQVTVEKNPYRSEIVDMHSTNSKVDGKVAAKYSPEAYNVVATRATNRMLQDTGSLSDNGQKRIFLKDTKLLSSDLPFGSNRLKSTTKDIISGSKTYDLVNNSAAADFIVDSSADWYVTNTAAPALQYKLSMFDKSGKKVNEWVEIIRQVQE
jgi:hypothetical protein